MLEYIPAPWILWELASCPGFELGHTWPEKTCHTPHHWLNVRGIIHHLRLGAFWNMTPMICVGVVTIQLGHGYPSCSILQKTATNKRRFRWWMIGIYFCWWLWLESTDSEYGYFRVGTARSQGSQTSKCFKELHIWHVYTQWIGIHGIFFQETRLCFTIFYIGLSCKFSPKPIHWYTYLISISHVLPVTKKCSMDHWLTISGKASHGNLPWMLAARIAMWQTVTNPSSCTY